MLSNGVYKMQMANQERREDPMPQRTLDFRQAMKDFRTMFPTLDSELIECVLRSNGGHVDSTIDQLLQLSQDPNGTTNVSRRRALMRTAYDDSTDSEESIPSELLDPPTSSDDDVLVRDPPPMYTPRVGDPVPNFFGPTHPVEVPITHKKKASHKYPPKISNSQTKATTKSYRAWNPPMLGALPEDFLRILPQQFLESSSSSSTKEKTKLQKTTSGSKKRTPTSNSVHRNTDISPANRSTYSGDPRETPARPEKCNPTTITPLSHHAHNTNNIENTEENLTPPPRPPRTMQPRRVQQFGYRDRNVSFRPDHIEHGSLFIRPASESQNFHHQTNDPTISNGQRQRPHRSSRSSHGSRSHNNLPPTTHQHQSVPCSTTTTGTNGSNHTRRSSDFASRRLVMASRSSEPAIPVSHNNGNNLNGFQSPLSNERTSSHRSYQRSSSNSFNHQTSSSAGSGHHSPVFQRGGSPAFTSSQSRSSGRPSSASSSSRSRPRTSHEQEQYVEDYRLAILLQNEEFIRELKRNDEFLKALEKDRPDNMSERLNNVSPAPTTPDTGTTDKDIVPLPDPDAKYPHGSQNPSSLKRVGMEDPEKEEEKVFKENLKHMGKSARKKFNEIAKKFSVKRKSSYKSMKNIDPVFANCDDNFDEVPGPRSPVFDL